MEKNNNIMKGSGENGKWITVNGAHIFVEDGQSVEDAMNKKFGKPKPRNADGSFNIPSIHESLKRDYENGDLTLEQVAEEYFKAGHTTYVNVDYAKKQLGITDKPKAEGEKQVQNLSKEAEDWANTTLKETIKKTPTEGLQKIVGYWEEIYKVQHDAYSQKMLDIYGGELAKRK